MKLSSSQIPQYCNGLGSQSRSSFSGRAKSGRPSTMPIELASSIPRCGLAPGGMAQGAARKNIQPRVCMARSATLSQPMLVGTSVEAPTNSRKAARPRRMAASPPRMSRLLSGNAVLSFNVMGWTASSDRCGLSPLVPCNDDPRPGVHTARENDTRAPLNWRGACSQGRGAGGATGACRTGRRSYSRRVHRRRR